jgi:hypothetical protein
LKSRSHGCGTLAAYGIGEEVIRLESSGFDFQALVLGGLVHGADSAIGEDGGHGLSSSDMLENGRNPPMSKTVRKPGMTQHLLRLECHFMDDFPDYLNVYAHPLQ